MTSPNTLNPVRTFYFDAHISPEMRKHEQIDCFNGDDLCLIFTAYDDNGNKYDLTGATAQFLVADVRNNLPLVQLSESAGIVLSGTTATVTFNTSLMDYSGKFNTQLILQVGGKGGVCAFGNIVNTRLIGDTQR